MNRVWSVTLGDATRKLILLKYADHAHEDGRNTWAKPRTVADFAECSERTVQRHLGWLLAEGYMREGDQSSYVPPRNPRSKARDARYQPIVYDISMDEETRLRWKEEAAQGGGRRAMHARGGAVRHTESSPDRGDNLAPLRGDTVTPLAEQAAEDAQVSRGDDLTPLRAGAASEVTRTPGSEVTRKGGSEVTAVSPKEPPTEPPVEPPVSDSSLRSESRRPTTRAAANDGMLDVATAELRSTPPRTKCNDDDLASRGALPAELHGSAAEQIVRRYISWFKSVTKDPRILDEQRTVMALKGQYIVKALEAGYSPVEIRTALSQAATLRGQDQPEVQPSKAVWRQALLAAAGGRDLSTARRPGRAPRRRYDDSEWKNRPAAADVTSDQPMTSEALESIFGPPAASTAVGGRA